MASFSFDSNQIQQSLNRNVLLILQYHCLYGSEGTHFDVEIDQKTENVFSVHGDTIAFNLNNSRMFNGIYGAFSLENAIGEPSSRDRYHECLIIFDDSSQMTSIPPQNNSSEFEYVQIARERPFSIIESAPRCDIDGVRVWVFGNDKKLLKYIPVEPATHCLKEIEIFNRFESMFLKNGTYTIIIEYSNENNNLESGYDEYLNDSRYPDNLKGNRYKIPLFVSLNDAADPAVIKEKIENLGGTYVLKKFNLVIEDPWIDIDLVSDHKTGDRFNITGTTNLPVGDEILVEVYPVSFKAGSQCQCADVIGATGIIKVTSGDYGVNKWIFPIDTNGSYWKIDVQVVYATARTSDVQVHMTFNLTAV
jgi:hypothetical protein